MFNFHAVCYTTVDAVASKPRPSSWLWVETQQTSEGTSKSSSSEQLAGTSSPGSSDDLQHDRRDQYRPTVSPRVQPTPPKSTGSPSLEGRVHSPVSEFQRSLAPGAGAVHGSKSAADVAEYRSTLTAELTPPKQQTSPRVSPLAQSHRVLTPPIVKTGDMPFISDRTFPVPASTTGSGQSTTRVPGESSAGRPCICPRSPTGTPKPPPPPRTVSVKSPAVEVAKSSQTSESYEATRSYSQSSSSESSKYSHSELFSDTTGSYEYSEQFQTFRNYPEDEARRLQTSPGQVPMGREPPHSEYSVTDPSRGEAKNQSGLEDCRSDEVGQLTTDAAAVDMLFSYHQMTRDAGDDQFSTSMFSSRCSPAVTTPSQLMSSASPRTTVRPTHYYV